MESTAVQHLIAGGETALVEFKVAPPRSSDLASRLCGFANGAGGTIIFGVADASWEDVAPDAAATESRSPRGRVARQEAALRYVQEHGTISNKVYRALTGVSAMTAVRDLEALVEQGALRVVGNGRSQRYTR